jgi:RNA polymerase sigma factor (sigma-70 family)
VGTAVDRYHISEIDAEALAHEVFLAYFLKADEILDSRAWLVSALCNASKGYLRSRARLLPLPDRFSESPDPRQDGENLPDQLVAREAFACVTAKCQIALRLRYMEGYSIPEVAEELKTSAKYAAKLVRRCLKQAQSRYAKKGDER